MPKQTTFVLCVLLCVAPIVYLIYTVYFKNKLTHFSPTTTVVSKMQYNLDYRRLRFDKNNGDVLSFIHIQKTGGTTFEKHLVLNLQNGNCLCELTQKPSCMCYARNSTEIWLICRFIQPKWPCGLHPDYSTLSACAPNFMNSTYVARFRRYFYATLLRDPLQRFLSEFRHVQRGASWEFAASQCRGTQISTQEKCYSGTTWLDLQMNDFLSCRTNLAFSRQTWMLSNVSQVNCSPQKFIFKEKLRKKLLSIAKKNLASMAYVGLLEFPVESQYVFEKTFNLKFVQPFQKWNTSYAKEYLSSFNISAKHRKQIEYVNKMDIKLYAFAKKILFERYSFYVSKYGPPVIQPPPKQGRFNLNMIKALRMKDNLPKSKAKELKLLKKKKG